MKPQTYYIYSPFSDQSLVISTLLRKYFPNANLIGVVLHGEKYLKRKFDYDKIIRFCELDRALISGVEIPTGAISTKKLLEESDIKLGAITMSQSMLSVYDKVWMISKAFDAGVPTPQTWEKVEEVSRYPLFYKLRMEEGVGARGIALSGVDIPPFEQENLIFQELIESQGTYGVSFVATKGNILASNIHYEPESIPKEGGSAVYIERFEDHRILRYTSKLIEFINYSGWGLAEFKYCPSRDEYYFMEINAKFWASCEFSFVNEPLFLELLFSIKSKEKTAIKMVFVDRVRSREYSFLVKCFRYFSKDIVVRSYSGLLKSSIFLLIPNSIRKSLKKIIPR